jgi:hypothetical protein
MRLRPIPHLRSQRGALMGAALLLMMVGGLFISGWTTLMSTRAVQVSWLESAMQRRIFLENSRLFSWQNAVSTGLDIHAGSSSGAQAILGGNRGGILLQESWSGINAYASMNLPATMSTVFPFNHGGLRPGESFLVHARQHLPGSLAGQIDSFTAHHFIKSYCPVLAGDLFVVYRKPDKESELLDIYNAGSSNALWEVRGRTVIRHPGSLFAKNTSRVTLPFRSRSVYVQGHRADSSLPVSGTDLNDNPLLPSNLPSLPSSTGPHSSSGSGLFDGYLNVVSNSNNPDNSLTHIMAREQAAGHSGFEDLDVFVPSADITQPYWMIEHGAATSPPLLPYPGYDGLPLRTLYIRADHPNLPHLIIREAVVNQVVIVGQTGATAFDNAGAMSPVILAIAPRNPNAAVVFDPVAHLGFLHENNRRLVIGARHPSGAQLNLHWGGSPAAGTTLRWRMTMVNEYYKMLLALHPDPAMSIQWIGGVMTNWFFKRSQNTGPRVDRLVFVHDAAVPTAAQAGPAYSTLLPRDAWLESYFQPYVSN